mmetsp:Transcript_1642/g.3369  ORF Transcript_1642/g.3369 Transcript_1642/m.3369 type:complete len:569 (+) Transcript_1642:13-1719(+)
MQQDGSGQGVGSEGPRRGRGRGRGGGRGSHGQNELRDAEGSQGRGRGSRGGYRGGGSVDGLRGGRGRGRGRGGRGRGRGGRGRGDRRFNEGREGDQKDSEETGVGRVEPSTACWEDDYRPESHPVQASDHVRSAVKARDEQTPSSSPSDSKIDDMLGKLEASSIKETARHELDLDSMPLSYFEEIMQIRELTRQEKIIRQRLMAQEYANTIKEDQEAELEAWRDDIPADEKLELALFGRPSTGINFDKYDDIPVDMKGVNLPRPLGAGGFEDVDLGPILKRTVELARYTKPTPVQRYAIPTLLAGRDLMACAQTGSGKTAAFLLPQLHAIMRAPDSVVFEARGNRRCSAPLGLILSPTRELAVQIYEEARKFCYRSRIHPVVVYGGADMHAQIQDIRRGAHLLVATPGRLVDLIQRGYVSLKQILFLTLDEADRMLDMGFEVDILKIVLKSDMPQKEDRQTLMFSATFPERIQRLARQFLNDYVFLSVGRVGSTVDSIQQRVECIEEKDKPAMLSSLLSRGMDGLTIVFVSTKRGAEALEAMLYEQKFPVTSIHGDRSQREREFALET